MKVAKGHVKSNKGSLNGYELKSGNVSNNKRKVQNKKRKVHTEKILLCNQTDKRYSQS